ncbi:MAG: glutamine--tRNA ligase/YqeY domain fusion protein [Oscillospiraceae bacterium]|nr:glutamine--tRNA ligase/YqeY domain fusion protein [Oscillospiraceae bacterium]
MAEEIKTPETEESGKNFILNFIDEDIAEGGQFQGMTVHTRFPPEPNGYLHIGHCKALTIDFGTAEKYNGLCNLRMDDTNPTKEDEEFVEAIKQDIHWLGFDWGDRFFYGSDYFEEDYRQAVLLIKKGLAYVCQLTPEEFKQNRGDIGIPAVSPYRDRPVEESLDLFSRMRAGEFPNGAMTLRAKIDLTSGNFNMRDPVIYRINHMSHHRQGNKWCIYPMYDFAHPIQDALEGITHSLCSLEFEAHRPLYNWVIDHCELPARPRQIEFARLGIDHTVMSKRKLRKLVEEHYVSGWDDPRMPTLCGLRRRGYTAASIRNFCERIGVAKSPNVIEYGFLEHCLREDLNANAERTMAVLHPVKLTVTNYPEGQSETFTVENNPTDPAQGTHEITFSRHLWIEEDDFMEVPVPKYKRLTPNGPECRLKGAYLVTCTGCVKDESGRVVEVLCTYDPDSRGGDPADGRKVKGATLHWVDAENCLDAEVRLYDNLFSDATPDGPDKDFLDCLNPDSLTVLTGCKVEPEMRKVAEAFDKQENRTGVNAPTFQFMRVGYFCMDNRDCTAEHLVFDRSVSLKDSFKK